MPPWKLLPKPTPLGAVPAKNTAADLTASASGVNATPTMRVDARTRERHRGPALPRFQLNHD
jgi:hypothetical protein